MTSPQGYPLDPAVFRKGSTGSRALRGLLDRKAPAPARPAAGAGGDPFWSLDFFGLDRARLLRDASPEDRRLLALDLGRGLLREALGIERAGMVFACRMSLLAESAEEQALFNHFAAEEAAHHRAFAAFLPPADAVPPARPDPFTAALQDLVATGTRGALLYVVQVVLEGWGLRHYRRLLDACREPSLADALRGILKDEAAHHSGGRILLKETRLSPAEIAHILARMRAFLGQVSKGPAALVQACEGRLGPLSPAARAELLGDIAAETDTRDKLAVLRELVHGAGIDAVTGALEAEDAFSPRLPAQEEAR